MKKNQKVSLFLNRVPVTIEFDSDVYRFDHPTAEYYAQTFTGEIADAIDFIEKDHQGEDSRGVTYTFRAGVSDGSIRKDEAYMEFAIINRRVQKVYALFSTKAVVQQRFKRYDINDERYFTHGKTQARYSGRLN